MHTVVADDPPRLLASVPYLARIVQVIHERQQQGRAAALTVGMGPVSHLMQGA